MIIKGQMTARFSLRKGSAYFHLNLQEFPVYEIAGHRVTLLIDGNQVDFGLSEIVSFKEVPQAPQEKLFTRDELIDACYKFKAFNREIAKEGRSKSSSEWFQENYPSQKQTQ